MTWFEEERARETTPPVLPDSGTSSISPSRAPSNLSKESGAKGALRTGGGPQPARSLKQRPRQTAERRDES